MRRIAPGALYALAFCLPTGAAFAEEVAPFYEFEITKQGQPTRYLTNAAEAGAAQVANHCEAENYTACVVTDVWRLGSIYVTDFDFIKQAAALKAQPSMAITTTVATLSRRYTSS
jgi:hypothetical protein